jgi:phosphatidate cytidylyltransferase
MAAVSLVATWYSVGTFAILVSAVAMIVAWEWGHIVRKTDFDLIFVVSAAAIAGAIGFTLWGLVAPALLVLVIGAMLSALLGFEKLGRMSALGVLYGGLPAVALIWLRSGEPHGLAAVLFLFAVVWGTDTGAYAAGRAIGGPKLMPSLSPNKTWAGLLGGVTTSILLALIFSAVVTPARAAWLVPVAIVLAVISQAGDLMESALKRWHGVKDASSLIPGHGGFMDRVDGLIFAAVAAAIGVTFLNVHAPARALLLGH